MSACVGKRDYSPTFGCLLGGAGGSPLGKTYTEAAQMRDVFVEDFNAPLRRMERESMNSYNSAFITFDILHPESVSRIVLVTPAAHMRRATLVSEYVRF